MFTGIFRRLPRAACWLLPWRHPWPPSGPRRRPNSRSSDPLAGALQRRRRSDIATRIVARHVADALGQPMVVENRPGAATIVAAQETARAAPDGYTLMTAGMSTLALNPWLYRKLPYDPQKNLAPVSTLVDLPIVLVVSPDSNLHTLADVIAYLKSDKAPSYASLGVGSPHHLAMELFLETVKGKATAIPYKGTPPALQDVASGVVPLMMADLAAARR